MKMTPSLTKPRIHFIGIGGIGMSSLAQWFLAQKWAVTGSDMAESLITRDAKKRGVGVVIGQKAANIPRQVDIVVRTQAVKPENPEFAHAKRLGVLIRTYPELVGELTEGYQTIAIAGAHGKSTTTALAALTLIRAKFDPTVVVGTRLREFGNANFRFGQSPWLVLEADEYGKAFLNYAPVIAIITNIDKEHLDTYGTLAGVKRAFLAFANRIAEGGVLIVNRDDANIVSLRKKFAAIAKKKHLKLVWYTARTPIAARLRRILQIPGEHNVANALAVLALAKLIRIPERAALETLGRYRGSWRRFDRRGTFRGAAVFDDYAHHPTEIRATLQGFRAKFPGQKILCVYEPHQAERLRRLWPEFQDVFADADTTLITPVYRVAGRDAEHPKYNARELARAMQKRHPNQKVFYLENLKSLKRAISTLLKTMDEDSCLPSPARSMPRRASRSRLKPIIVMMGAGTIAEQTNSLISRKL